MIDQYLNKIHNVDCLEFMKELPDKCIDLVLTDIPYNISKKSNGLRKLDYGEWDKQYGKELEWIASLARITKGSIIVFCGKKQFSGLINYLDDNDFSTRTIIWHKPNPTVLNCDKLYIESTELAVYGKRAKATFNPDYKHNLFEKSAPTEREHPTQKPEKLFIELVLDCSQPNSIIFDGFIGSGTTAIACLKTGRKFIGCEISKKYCDIANKRIDDFLAQQDLFREAQ